MPAERTADSSRVRRARAGRRRASERLPGVALTRRARRRDVARVLHVEHAAPRHVDKHDEALDRPRELVRRRGAHDRQRAHEPTARRVFVAPPEVARGPRHDGDVVRRQTSAGKRAPPRFVRARDRLGRVGIDTVEARLDARDVARAFKRSLVDVDDGLARRVPRRVVEHDERFSRPDCAAQNVRFGRLEQIDGADAPRASDQRVRAEYVAHAVDLAGRERIERVSRRRAIAATRDERRANEKAERDGGGD